jgi:hypothetical protein
MSYGVGVERVFAIESPTVAKVEIKRRGHVRRARLYYLRELTGKKARLRSKVRDIAGLVSEEEADARAGISQPEEASEVVEPELSDEATESAETTESDEPSEDSKAPAE